MAASAHQDAMFVSPDNLVIDHQLDHGYGQHEPSPLPDTNPQHDQQNRSLRARNPQQATWKSY